MKKLMKYGFLSFLLSICFHIYAQDSIPDSLNTKPLNDSSFTFIDSTKLKKLDTTLSKPTPKTDIPAANNKLSAVKKKLPKSQKADSLDESIKKFFEPIPTNDSVAVDSISTQNEAISADKDRLPEISNLVSGSKIFYSIILLLIGYVVIRVVTFILDALAERSTNYRIAFKGSIPIIKIVGWLIIFLLIITAVFQPSMATMLTVSASIGVAIGFASQDILKNIFGGVIILLDRPFVSGDKIEVDKYYGEVVEIGLRSTRIVTPDDSLVSVPNAVMMNSSVSNANAGEPNCQVVAEIFLPLNIDTIKTREIATQAATVSKYIYLEKPIAILFLHEINNHKSYYKMRVKAYVRDIRDEFIFKSDMTELIVAELVKQEVLKH